MPHLIVKMYPGRSDAEKHAMAGQLAALLHESMGFKLGGISVAVEEIEPARWMQDVYEPEISGREGQLLKRPGHGPLAIKSTDE